MPTFIDFDRMLDNLGSSPFVVEAYRIRISTKLSQPSCAVELRAKEIIFTAEGAIDVMGSPGAPKGTATPSTVAGAGGNPGETGDSGHAGGSITLVCERLIGGIRLTANGGNGGNGQNGSDGQKGQKGADGGNNRKGGRGGNGGDAGKGGNGGNGGAGGLILISCADSSKATLFVDSSAVAGGGHGLPGENGKWGDPGEPGANGYLPGGAGERRAPTGPTDIGNDGPGLAGHAVSPAPPGLDGQPGKFTVETAQAAMLRLRQSLSDRCLQLVLDKAQDDYYNTSYSDAAEILTFVSLVSAQ